MIDIPADTWNHDFTLTGDGGVGEQTMLDIDFWEKSGATCTRLGHYVDSGTVNDRATHAVVTFKGEYFDSADHSLIIREDFTLTVDR